MLGDDTHPIFLKTQKCKFHTLGKCMRAGDCKFAHTKEELAPTPDFSRTKMCPELKKTGRCTRGTGCTFAHSAAELRSRGNKRLVKQAAEFDAPAEGSLGGSVRAARRPSDALGASVPLMIKHLMKQAAEFDAPAGGAPQLPMRLQSEKAPPSRCAPTAAPGSRRATAAAPPSRRAPAAAPGSLCAPAAAPLGRCRAPAAEAQPTPPLARSAVEAQPVLLVAQAQSPPPPQKSAAEAQPVLLVAQALPMRVRAIQLVPVQCVQVPMSPSCNGLGGHAASFAGAGQGVPEVPQKEARDYLNHMLPEDIVEASCGKEDGGLELPDSSWSRQSTDADVLEEFAGFSRQSTQDDAWKFVEADDLDDQPMESGGVLNMEACMSANVSAAAEQEAPVFPLGFARLGYVVKNTFIELGEEESSSAPLRRTRSTGEVSSSAL